MAGVRGEPTGVQGCAACLWSPQRTLRERRRSFYPKRYGKFLSNSFTAAALSWSLWAGCPIDLTPRRCPKKGQNLSGKKQQKTELRANPTRLFGNGRTQPGSPTGSQQASFKRQVRNSNCRPRRSPGNL